MGLPINIHVAGRYEITVDSLGVNKKVIVTRLADSQVEQEVISEKFFQFMDSLFQATHDQPALTMACDTLFAS